MHTKTVCPDWLDKVDSRKRSMITTKEINNTYDMNQQKRVKASGVDQLIKKEERETSDIGLKPYVLYLSLNKDLLYGSLVALSHAIFISGQISQNSWKAANVQNPKVSMLRLITVYLAIDFGTLIFLLSRSVLAVVLGLASSRSLFSQLLYSLFHAPMSIFDSTPLGRILSHVSSDLNLIDHDVPFNFLFSLSATMNAYNNLGLLVVVTWPILLVFIPVICLSIRLQIYYLASAKELMRINGTMKSLVANHLAESISGAIIIRAFGEEDRFFAKNLELIDKNASPFFHNFAASEWLIQRLETMSAIVFSSSAIVMALLPPGTFSSVESLKLNVLSL